MTAIFIIPNNTTRFIGINFRSTSSDTIIISKLTTTNRMEYLSHTLRYCSILLGTNISPAITTPTTIIIAITRKHHDHSVEKYSFSPKIFNSDGQITHLHTYTKLLSELLYKQINRSEPLCFLLSQILQKTYIASAKTCLFFHFFFKFLFSDPPFLHRFCILLNLLYWHCIVLTFFSASFCFFCASSTASTDDLFTCICNLQFWSRTSFISSSSSSCSLLLFKPFLFLRVVALLKRLIQLLRFGQFGCQTLNFYG